MVEYRMLLDIYTNGRYILVTISLTTVCALNSDRAAHGCYLRFHVSYPVYRAVDGGCIPNY